MLKFLVELARSEGTRECIVVKPRNENLHKDNTMPVSLKGVRIAHKTLHLGFENGEL